jgi:hypothetical protein
MSSYTLTPWPTIIEDATPRSVFFFETFQPEFMNLVGRYRDGILKDYISGEPHTIVTQSPIEPILPDEGASAKEFDFYKIISSKFDRDYKKFEEQRLEISNLKNALVSALDRNTQLSILGTPEDIIDTPLPTIWNKLRTASNPQPTDISSIMTQLHDTFLHVHAQSFANHCVKFRKAQALLAKFKCSKSAYEDVAIFQKSLESSHYAADFAPFIAQYLVHHSSIDNHDVEDLMRLAQFAIATIESKLILSGVDRATLNAVQDVKDIPAPTIKTTIKRRYCHTHGSNPNHGSKYRTAPGPHHDKSATYFDQKGGKPSS